MVKKGMNRICAVCGKPVQGGIAMGATLLCLDCDPVVQEEIERRRNAGHRVDIRQIARKLFRETADPQVYMLKDIPGALWAATKHAADDTNTDLRQLLLKGLVTLPEVQKYLKH